jgi:RNA recognition motif-containing protein
MPIRLYVGNLPKELERKELEAVFSDSGSNTLSTKIITDRKTGKCRGFGFVTVQTDEQADEIIEQFNGFMLKESAIKIEKALPRTKSKGNESGNGNSEAVISNPSPSSGSSNNSNRRKGGGNKSRRAASGGSASNDNDNFQPDPRWAQELAQLKELLAAQTAGS